MFEDAIHWSVKLVVFLSQHDFVYTMMLRMPGAHALVMAVETRFAKHIYSTEHLLNDMATIKAVLNGGEVAAWVQKQKASVRTAHREVTEWVGKTGGAETFWEIVAIFAGDQYKPAIAFFIRLVTAHGGQGGAERQNKQVKKFRTTTRNRQTHKVTAAYMEIDTTLRMRDAVTAGRQVVPYLKAVRWAIQDALDEAEEGEEEGEEEGAGAGGGGGGGDGDGGGGLDGEAQRPQRPLGYQALLGIFHRGVDKDGPFVQGDVGDVDDVDAPNPVPEPHL